MCQQDISLTELAFPVGLEPTTFGLENQCSLQLSYENCIVLSLFVLGCISNTLTPHSITESFKSGLPEFYLGQ